MNEPDGFRRETSDTIVILVAKPAGEEDIDVLSVQAEHASFSLVRALAYKTTTSVLVERNVTMPRHSFAQQRSTEKRITTVIRVDRRELCISTCSSTNPRADPAAHHTPLDAMGE